MKKFMRFVLAIMLFTNLYAKNSETFQSVPLDQNFLSKNIPIIDIRTKPEWIQTGIIPKSHTITFFEYGPNGYIYDVETFLEKLNKIVSKNDKFALLCRSGNRTSMLSNFLYQQGYKNVINLNGGIKAAIKNGIKTQTYK